jgi:hypothetical protein
MEFNNEYEIELEFNKEQKKSKRQKINEECKLCFHEIISTTLKCGHTMCSECCIKHFRKSENCPFCRKMICEKEDRTDEYEHIITSDLKTKYHYFAYDNKLMSMYDFLKLKGINKQDANEILLSIEDRCHEMFIESEKYSESFPISEDNLYHYETSSDSDDETDNINTNLDNSYTKLILNNQI